MSREESSGVQEFRSSGVQEFRSSGVLFGEALASQALFLEFFHSKFAALKFCNS